MKKIINCFIPYEDNSEIFTTIEQLERSSLVKRLYLLLPKGGDGQKSSHLKELLKNCQERGFLVEIYPLPLNSLSTTVAVKEIASLADTPLTLIYRGAAPFVLDYFALERLARVAKESGAAMLYSHYYKVVDEVVKEHPTIEFQKGSVREGFDFGPLLLFNSALFKEAASLLPLNYSYAALYYLILRASQKGSILQLKEYLYSQTTNSGKGAGDTHFSYLDPKNRAAQIEFEEAFTQHLKEIGGYLPPPTKEIDFGLLPFDNEASIIIPVYNRVKTVKGAIESALGQSAHFNFNVIVVDNHSTDGTTQLIEELLHSHPHGEQLIHIIPQQRGLKIGGCWNLALHHPQCGKFALQLDSDDLYSSPHTLRQVVECFYRERCAMVIGSYLITDFNLKEIPPGAIEHREWSNSNGHNNALRINGLGAPRAFYTPLLRELKLPNSSYGEDYAIALRITREWKIGRIYDILYLCRRWEGNSDSSLTIEAENRNNRYKDSLRTIELMARVKINSEGQ
ncbi:MAG: glycosyltransferase family A protein [Bacteroidales bacterium]